MFSLMGEAANPTNRGGSAAAQATAGVNWGWRLEMNDCNPSLASRTQTESASGPTMNAASQYPSLPLSLSTMAIGVRVAPSNRTPTTAERSLRRAVRSGFDDDASRLPTKGQVGTTTVDTRPGFSI
jgi:hypothetical protein